MPFAERQSARGSGPHPEEKIILSVFKYDYRLFQIIFMYLIKNHYFTVIQFSKCLVLKKMLLYEKRIAHTSLI